MTLVDQDPVGPLVATLLDFCDRPVPFGRRRVLDSLSWRRSEARGDALRLLDRVSGHPDASALGMALAAEQDAWDRLARTGLYRNRRKLAAAAAGTGRAWMLVRDVAADLIADSERRRCR